MYFKKIKKYINDDGVFGKIVCKFSKNVFFLFFSDHIKLIKIFNKKKTEKNITIYKKLKLKKKQIAIRLENVNNTENVFKKIKSNLSQRSFCLLKTENGSIINFVFPSQNNFHLNFFNLSINHILQQSGPGEIFQYRNKIEFLDNHGGVSINISRFFPYNYKKTFRIGLNSSAFSIIFFHPLFIIIKNTSNVSKIYTIEKKNNFFVFKKTGIIKDSLDVVSIDYVIEGKTIYLCLNLGKKLYNLKILLDDSKKIKSLTILSSIKLYTISTIDYLVFKKDLTRVIITGSSDGKIIVWNNYLYPIIYISNPDSFIHKITNASFFDSFFVIMKKGQNNSKRDKRFRNSEIIFPISITNFSSDNFLSNSPCFLLNQFYSLMKKTIDGPFEKFLYIYENIKKRFLSTDNNIISNRVILKMCEMVFVNKLRPSSVKFIFLKILDKISWKTPESENSFFKKKSLMYLRIVGKNRNLSFSEIYIDLIHNKKKNFQNYFKCSECNRFYKIKLFSMKNRIKCPFFHFINENHLEEQYIKDYKFFKNFDYDLSKTSGYSSLSSDLKIFTKKDFDFKKIFQKNHFWKNLKEI
jgi:hypothetical protein